MERMDVDAFDCSCSSSTWLLPNAAWEVSSRPWVASNRFTDTVYLFLTWECAANKQWDMQHQATTASHNNFWGIDLCFVHCMALWQNLHNQASTLRMLLYLCRLWQGTCQGKTYYQRV
jgi:hypothetical protein